MSKSEFLALTFDGLDAGKHVGSFGERVERYAIAHGEEFFPHRQDVRVFVRGVAGLVTNRVPMIMRSREGTIIEVSEWKSREAIALRKVGTRLRTSCKSSCSFSRLWPVGQDRADSLHNKIDITQWRRTGHDKRTPRNGAARQDRQGDPPSPRLRQDQWSPCG